MRRPLHQKILFSFFFLLIATISYAQTGFVSGVIEDSNGSPLPGVSIVIKGKNIGEQTDFDGNYRIKCAIGDILVISYIGQKTREVKVTASMFGKEQLMTAIRRLPVAIILDSTYQAAVRKNLPSFLLVPSIEESSKTYNNTTYINADRIRDISIGGDKVKLTYFDSDIFYEVGASLLTGIQFVQDRNLPEIQNAFAQGRPMNGENTYLGPDTNTSFSYGPRLTSLEFDGSNYQFDPNGRLVPAGEGNGKIANRYANNPFQTIFKTASTLFFNLNSEGKFLGFDYYNKSGKDIYARESNSLDEFTLKFNNIQSYSAIEWKAQLKYINSIENQPNLNGFQNNLLFNALATPISFNNNQGGTLQNDSQRSFDTNRFNNPQWLLNANRNRLINEIWVGTLQNRFALGGNAHLKSKLSYTLGKNKQQFGLFRTSVGFIDGYRSDKMQEKDVFDTDISFDWQPYINNFGFDIVSTFLYSNENLKYDFSEQVGFADSTFNNPENSSLIERNLSRATFRWFSRVNFNFLDNKAKASLINNSFTATRQNTRWLLPSVYVKYEFARDWYNDFFQKLDFSAGFGYDVSYLDLFYGNQSHNSLEIKPEESLSYTANNDLFASDAVNLEEKESYDIGIDIGFQVFNKRWNLNTTYFSNTTNGSVFPILENNQYELQNVANIQNSGIELAFDTHIYNYGSSFQFTPSLIFSKYNTKVLDLSVPGNRVSIAGFSSISKNLIIGEQAGVLVGTQYERDAQRNIVIDAEGFPLVADELGIIGNPIPDFNLGFSSSLKWKDFAFDVVLDYQKGGDVWNGTQNVLNYLGTSQQSGLEREITGFIFTGVNESGEVNTVPVDFANPENGLSGNRFVRYGFEGIAEEAIVDGSYFNLKSFNLSYSINRNNDSPFFRELKLGIYGTNLFTISKFQGASPYRNLFDQTSSQGLNFFNSPIFSEIGMKINLKI